MPSARPPYNDARKSGEQKQYSAKAVDRLAGLPAEQIRMEIAHPIVECDVLFAIDQYVRAVWVNNDFANGLVLGLLLKSIGLDRSLPRIDSTQTKSSIALFEAAL